MRKGSVFRGLLLFGLLECVFILLPTPSHSECLVSMRVLGFYVCVCVSAAWVTFSGSQWLMVKGKRVRVFIWIFEGYCQTAVLLSVGLYVWAWPSSPHLSCSALPLVLCYGLRHMLSLSLSPSFSVSSCLTLPLLASNALIYPNNE